MMGKCEMLTYENQSTWEWWKNVKCSHVKTSLPGNDGRMLTCENPVPKKDFSKHEAFSVFNT